jgi:hypothetical protein
MSDSEIPRLAELVGATDKPFVLGGPFTTTCFNVEEPTGPAALRSGDPERYIAPKALLSFEKMLSEDGSPPLHIYLNLPQGKHPAEYPELLAGELSTFGLLEASISDQFHRPVGFNAELDVTHLYAALAAAENWKLRRLCVTFVSRYPGNLPPVRVGRVSLYLS